MKEEGKKKEGIDEDEKIEIEGGRRESYCCQGSVLTEASLKLFFSTVL